MGLGRKLTALGVIAALFIMNFSGVGYAQQSGQGLEISPPLIELTVDPGQQVSFDIKIRNITTGTLIAKPAIDDFTAEGEDGQPKLLLEESPEPNPYSFKAWAQPMADLSVIPQEVKTATVTLNVPADATPGGHYGVVRFTAVPPELEGTGVALSASIGTLVLINVTGDVVRKASIVEFVTLQNGQHKSFFETGPINLMERVRNEGSVHIKPTGTLRITNMFNKEVAVISINEKGGNILPGSIRRFEQQLSKPRLFGRYKVEANIQYGGDPLSQTLTFWVIPYKLIALVLGMLLITIAALRIGVKRYNRHIISKAQNGKSKKK